MTNLNDFKPEKNDKIRFYGGDVFNNAHKNVIEYIKDFNQDELEDFYSLLKGFENNLYGVFRKNISNSLNTLKNSMEKVEKYIQNKDKCYKDTIQFIKYFLISIDDSLILKDANEIEYDELKPVIYIHDKNGDFFHKIYVSRYDRFPEFNKFDIVFDILNYDMISIKDKESLEDIYNKFCNKYNELLRNEKMNRISDFIHENANFSCRCNRGYEIKSNSFKDKITLNCDCGCKITFDCSDANELYK